LQRTTGGMHGSSKASRCDSFYAVLLHAENGCSGQACASCTLFASRVSHFADSLKSSRDDESEAIQPGSAATVYACDGVTSRRDQSVSECCWSVECHDEQGR
jgi:hypothetical protein